MKGRFSQGLVAQRLEQRTHNAHETIRQQVALTRKTAEISSVYVGFLARCQRMTAQVRAADQKAN